MTVAFCELLSEPQIFPKEVSLEVLKMEVELKQLESVTFELLVVACMAPKSPPPFIEQFRVHFEYASAQVKLSLIMLTYPIKPPPFDTQDTVTLGLE